MPDKQNTTAKVAAFAEMCDFPCHKQDLLLMAEEQEFPDEVVDVLEDLPRKEYTCESDLIEAAKGVVEPLPTQESGVEAER